MLFLNTEKKINYIENKIKKYEVDLNIIKINIEKTTISLKNIENKIKAYKNIVNDYEIKGAIALKKNKEELYKLSIKKSNDIYKEINLLQLDYLDNEKELNFLRKKESIIEKKISKLKARRESYTKI